MSIKQTLTGLVSPIDPWQAIYEALYKLMEQGTESKKIKIYCSDWNQRVLRYMFDLEYGPALVLGGQITFMGITFEDYPFNSEILVFVERDACYFENLAIRIPFVYKEKPEEPKSSD